MVPGITDTECRIAEFRSRDLRAEAERQRLAASAAHTPSDRAGQIAVNDDQAKALMLRLMWNAGIQVAWRRQTLAS